MIPKTERLDNQAAVTRPKMTHNPPSRTHIVSVELSLCSCINCFVCLTVFIFSTRQLVTKKNHSQSRYKCVKWCTRMYIVLTVPIMAATVIVNGKCVDLFIRMKLKYHLGKKNYSRREERCVVVSLQICCVK